MLIKGLRQMLPFFHINRIIFLKTFFYLSIIHINIHFMTILFILWLFLYLKIQL